MIRGGAIRIRARAGGRAGPAPRPPLPAARAGHGPGGPPAWWPPRRPWRPLTSARSRILGWSVVLLAAGIAVSTLATRVVLTQAMDSRVNAELAHEIAEFRALEARRGADEPRDRRAPGAGSAAARAALIAC